jgi:hypothetical protein
MAYAIADGEAGVFPNGDAVPCWPFCGLTAPGERGEPPMALPPAAVAVMFVCSRIDSSLALKLLNIVLKLLCYCVCLL